MIRILLSVFFSVFLCMLQLGHAQEAIHHGPALEAYIQRTGMRLPLAQVNHLQKGDQILVRVDTDTLSKGDWALVLASVSPTGNQVQSTHFDIKELKGWATLDITADEQVPVMLLAPQIRNLFGLYTSLSASADLLDGVLRTDPQRFYDLQKVDEINQAIQAINHGLIQQLQGRSHGEAIEVAKNLASQFGVRNLDTNCFKNETVNTECVANNIVTNRDFSLPSAKDLTAMIGNKSALDLNSFLMDNLRLISQASEYLGNKYRDSYDFAPTFGRRQANSARIELFSLARFQSGNIKTAYIYVPAWSNTPMPLLDTNNNQLDCYTSGQLKIEVKGRLPVGYYWHDWHLDVLDGETQQFLGQHPVQFEQAISQFIFQPLDISEPKQSHRQQVWVVLEGQFGFQQVRLKPIRMALPWNHSDDLSNPIEGLSGLVAGEKTRLSLKPGLSWGCIRGLDMALGADKIASSQAAHPHELNLDLSQTAPGGYNVLLHQIGSPTLSIPVRVLPPKVLIQQLEHTEWDEHLVVHGQQLQRLLHVRLGNIICSAHPHDSRPIPPNTSPLDLFCDGDVRNNAVLPDQALVVHVDNEPMPFKVTLSKRAAKPRIGIATDTPHALLTVPSAKSLQWQLAVDDFFVSADAGLQVLLKTESPYVLVKGSYALQLRFTDDPQSNANPITVPLMVNAAHQELRTVNPVLFKSGELPGVINPLEFRVQHKPSGESSDWQKLPRAVLLLPHLQEIACAGPAATWWLKGQHLDLIDSLRWAEGNSDFVPSTLDPCPTGLCLRLPAIPTTENGLEIRLRWVDGRSFTAHVPAAEHCPTVP